MPATDLRLVFQWTLSSFCLSSCLIIMCGMWVTASEDPSPENYAAAAKLLIVRHEDGIGINEKLNIQSQETKDGEMQNRNELDKDFYKTIHGVNKPLDCCDPTLSGTINAGTVSRVGPMPTISNTLKRAREIDILVKSHTETANQIPLKTRTTKPIWLFGKDSEQSAESIVQKNDDAEGEEGTTSKNWRRRQGVPAKERSALARMNQHFFSVGEPALLSVGILGNAVLAVVFLFTPLRARVVSHTLAAAGVCDLLYTVGCLLLHLASRGMNILVLPGTCQLLTFMLILSQVMATWCLFFSHLHRLNAHTKIGHEGRKRRVCKAKFSVMLLALLTVAVTVHYLWSMDKVTIAGRVFCAPMREMISAHLALRKLELVIGILLPLVLIAGIDLLLLLKLVVHLLVTMWDRDEDEDDGNMFGSSTFGAHKIVKMPLCRHIPQIEEQQTSWDNPAVVAEVGANVQQNSLSSVESNCAYVSLKHSVRIEDQNEKTLGKNCSECSTEEKDKQLREEISPDQTRVLNTDSESSNKSSNALSTDQKKTTSSIKPSAESEMYSEGKESSSSSEASDHIKTPEPVVCNIQLDRRVASLPPIQEVLFSEKETTENLKGSLAETDSNETLKHTSRNCSTTQSSSNSAENKSSVRAPSNMDRSGKDAFSRSMSITGKIGISSLKAVFSNKNGKKNKKDHPKKVGFFGEVSGDRTRSDNAAKKNRRDAVLFSYSGSGVNSKSSNTKCYSSYASYKSMDSSSSRGSYRPPEDQDFPDDTTACTVATVLMGVFLAILVLPATFRHAIRMFGTSASSQPSLKEMEVAVLLENLVKVGAVFKIFLCAISMNSFRYGLAWLWRRGMRRLEETCCVRKGQIAACDIADAV